MFKVKREFPKRIKNVTNTALIAAGMGHKILFILHITLAGGEKIVKVALPHITKGSREQKNAYIQMCTHRFIHFIREIGKVKADAINEMQIWQSIGRDGMCHKSNKRASSCCTYV